MCGQFNSAQLLRPGVVINGLVYRYQLKMVHWTLQANQKKSHSSTSQCQTPRFKNDFVKELLQFTIEV